MTDRTVSRRRRCFRAQSPAGLPLNDKSATHKICSLSVSRRRRCFRAQSPAGLPLNDKSATAFLVPVFFLVDFPAVGCFFFLLGCFATDALDAFVVEVDFFVVTLVLTCDFAAVFFFTLTFLFTPTRVLALALFTMVFFALVFFRAVEVFVALRFSVVFFAGFFTAAAAFEVGFFLDDFLDAGFFAAAFSKSYSAEPSRVTSTVLERFQFQLADNESISIPKIDSRSPLSMSLGPADNSESRFSLEIA